jgi:hypothetical protein
VSCLASASGSRSSERRDCNRGLSYAEEQVLSVICVTSLLLGDRLSRAVEGSVVLVRLLSIVEKSRYHSLTSGQSLGLDEAAVFLLLQLRVLHFGLLQDGDVGVSVFPHGEEVLVGFATTWGVTIHHKGASEL